MEEGDQLPVLVLDAHVVVAGAAAAALLGGVGGEGVAQARRRHVVDAAADGHGGFVVAVAGEGEGRVGQGEQVAAMAGAVALDHVFAHAHADHRPPRGDRQQAHAHALAGGIALEHFLGAAGGE
ncbi:hypothetical protein D3C81_1572180 [compost metagenome]